MIHALLLCIAKRLPLPHLDVRPPPPIQRPTPRAIALDRFENLPALLPPTGSDWANSPLSNAKARPVEPLPRFRILHANPERMCYFPSVFPGPPPRGGACPSESAPSDSETEDADDDDRDDTSTQSTAPSHIWEDWERITTIGWKLGLTNRIV